ncbi:MAG: hypothetical protein RBT65_19085 [Methanolobus sp.]|nr:hypothetical protein [Methanolobus sp.]
MRTITIKRPQYSSLPMVAFCESVIDDINTLGISGLHIMYHGKPMWIKESTYKDGDEWHRITAYITDGKRGINITFTEEAVKVEEEE